MLKKINGEKHLQEKEHISTVWVKVKKTKLWNKDGSYINTILTPVSMCKEMEVKGKAVLDLQSEIEVSFGKNSKSTKIFPAQLNCWTTGLQKAVRKDATKQVAKIN